MADFLTGRCTDKDETDWMVVERPDLRIIEPETYEKAQQILQSRNKAFNIKHERQSNKYLFSTLIKCKECSWSFRRIVRTYKNAYGRWVCSGHKGRGSDSCPNAVAFDEEELNQQLSRLQKTRQKYIDMYTDDLISREELNIKIDGMRKEIE